MNSKIQLLPKRAKICFLLKFLLTNPDILVGFIRPTIKNIREVSERSIEIPVSVSIFWITKRDSQPDCPLYTETQGSRFVEVDRPSLSKTDKRTVFTLCLISVFELWTVKNNILYLSQNCNTLPLK